MNYTLDSACRRSAIRLAFVCFCFSVVTVATCSFTHSLEASTVTWSSTATSGAWSNGPNWIGGTAPGATSGTANTDTAWFSGGSTTEAIVPDANRNLQNLTFDGSAAYTIGTPGGNALLLTSVGTIQMTATFSGSNTTEAIHAPLVLEGGSGSTYTLADNAANIGDLLSFGGPISGTATSAGTGVQTLNVTGNGAVSIGGVLSDGGGGGSLGLSLLGNGLLTLNGSVASTYSGPTQVRGGTLALSMSNMATPTNLVSSNSALVLGGGALLLSGNATGASSQAFNGTTVNAGASAVTVANNGGSGTTLALGAITRNEGGTVNFTLPGGGGGITTSASNSNGILGGWAIVNGTDWAAVSGGSIAATTSYSTSWGSGFNTTVSGTTTGYGATNSLRFTAPYARVNLDSSPTIIQSGGILVTNAAYGSYINDPSGSYVYTLTSAAPDLTIQVPGPGSQLTINASIVDNGQMPVGLTIAGSGSVTMNGGVSYFSGPVNLDSGTLTAALHGQAVTVAHGATLIPYANLLNLGSLAGAGTITNQGAPATILIGQNNASTTFSGVFNNFMNLYLTKVGQGTLTLSGSNAVLAGHTILNGSTLVLDYSTNAGPKGPGFAIGGGTVQIIPSTTAANLVAGSSLELPLPGSQIDYTQANYTPYSLGGAATIAVANIASSANIALGSISRAQGTSLNFVLPGNFTGHLTTTTANYDGILGGFATVNGVDWAANSLSSGSGNIVAYTGYQSFVKSGASNAGNYLLSGSNALNASEAMNSLKITDTGAGESLNLGGNNLSITTPASTNGAYGGAILYAGGASNSYTINGPGLLLSGTNANYQQAEMILDAAAGTVLTVNAQISGSMPLTKAGGGTVVLAASNGYTGGTYVSAGKLVITSSAALGTASGLSVGPGATFDVNGCALNGGIGLAGSGYDGNGALINSSTATASFNNANSSVTFNSDTTLGGAGNIQFGQLQTLSWGANTITKVGSDTLSIATPCATLSAANTLIINGGKVQYQTDNVLGATAVVVVNAGAVLDVNGHSDVVNQLTLNNGAALLGSSGTSSFVLEQYTSQSNKLVYGSLTATGSSSITGSNHGGLDMASGSINVVGTADVLNISAPLMDLGWTCVVTKTGAGTLILSGSNTYSGATTIAAGTLSLANSAALAGSGHLTFAGGTLQYSSSNSQDYSAKIVGSTAPIAIDTNGANVTFASNLASSNTGGLTKIGLGSLLLSGSNSYAGPTTVNGGLLAAGAVNTLSASSAMTISDGTLNVSGFANTVASLNVSASGCLNLGLGNTLASKGAAALSGTLNVFGTGTLGNYPLLTYSSENGQFAGVTGVGASYGLLYNSDGTELDALHKAQVGALTVTAASPTVITGGTTSLTVNVANSAPASSDVLNFTATAGGTGYGLSITGSAAAQNSGSVSDSFNSSTLAAGSYTGTVTVTGTNNALTGAALNSGGTQTVAVTVLDHSNASLSSTATQTSQTINFGNVLKGATIPSQSFTIYNLAAHTSAAYTANLKLTGFSASGDPTLTTNLATFNGLTANSGSNSNSFTAALNTSNYTTSGTNSVTISASQLTDDNSLPGAGSNNNGGITVTLQGNVGNAMADASNSKTAFGPALTAPIAVNGSYANLESTVKSTTGSGGFAMVGSTATILAGSNSGSGTAQTVSMAWRTQTTAEGTHLASDVLDLSGMALSGASGQTSPFVLQMDYDPDLLGGNEALLASDEMIYLDWLNPTTNQWQNAIGGNFGTNSNHFYLGGWPAGDMTLGDWGVNTANHTVWAVIDHNSDFAVVPEPSTLALLAATAMSLIGYGWRRRATRRTTKPADLDQRDAAVILSFHAHSLRTSAVRRAA